MSLLKKLFRQNSSDKLKYIEAMVEASSELECTYRSMIDTYNSDVELGVIPNVGVVAVKPTGRGIYKARLYGALFIVMAYVKSSNSLDDNQEMMDFATSVAIKPLEGSGEQCLDRAEAESFTMDFVLSTFKAMTAAFKVGPLLPDSIKQEHIALAEHLHDALAESIGCEFYSIQIRSRFSDIVYGNTAMAMNYAMKWISL